MRDVLIHDYFGVDLASVWGGAQARLPDLQQQIEKVMAETDPMLS